MEPIVPLRAMDLIANGIDHAEGICQVPNIGRWHVTRLRVPGIVGTPLFHPTRDEIGD